MRDVQQGRWRAEVDGDFVVFIIGARFQRWHPFRSLADLNGRRSMGYMLAELSKDPDSGLLGYELGNLTGTFVVQYWRSFAHLEAFSQRRDDVRRRWGTPARLARAGCVSLTTPTHHRRQHGDHGHAGAGSAPLGRSNDRPAAPRGTGAGRARRAPAALAHPGRGRRGARRGLVGGFPVRTGAGDRAARGFAVAAVPAARRGLRGRPRLPLPG